jgi:tetratricopeptide (TPR) repeat protein
VNAGALVMELSKEGGREAAVPGVANEGWAAYERGDVKLAARLLSEAAASPDAHPWVHYASGLANLADGRPADAAREWETVRAAVPQFQAVYFDLADAYLQLDDEGKVVSILRTGQQRWPSDPEVHNALGVAQVKRGALDDAIDSFGKAIAVAPAESLGYFNLARAYHMRYFKSHRYNAILNKWTGNDRDREMATTNFQKYIEMGGPYVQQARDALSTLAWK